MDRLFWPDPQFIAVTGPEDPWVLQLRGEVENALDAALAPLRVSAFGNSKSLYERLGHSRCVMRNEHISFRPRGEDLGTLVIPLRWCRIHCVFFKHSRFCDDPNKVQNEMHLSQ